MICDVINNESSLEGSAGSLNVLIMSSSGRGSCPEASRDVFSCFLELSD